MRITMATDYALLLRWRRHGDPAAFAQLVDRHAAMVHSASMRVVRNRAVAQEIAQDSFLQLTHLDRFDGESLGGWLHRVATNRALDIVKSESRRHVREAAFAAAHDTTATRSESAAVLAEIDAALSDLPIDLRELIVLHYLEGVTHRDIARRLGVSRPTVSRRLHLALDQLRESFNIRGITATAAAILTALESARAMVAPAALIAALRKLALTAPPAAASTTALLSPSMVALAGTVALLLFLAAVLIPQFVTANGEREVSIPVIPLPEIPAVIAEQPAEPDIVVAQNETHATLEPAALSPVRATENVILHCVDASGTAVPGAEVYLVRIQPRVFPAFAAAGPDDVGKTVYGPFESNAEGAVPIPPLEQPVDAETLAYEAFARVPGKLVGAWTLSLDPDYVRRDGWDRIVLTPSVPMIGEVTVPRGFDVTRVTIRLLSMSIRDGKNQYGSRFSNASKFDESTIPVLSAEHPDPQGRVQFDDMPVNGNIYLAATAPGLAETQFFTLERVEKFQIDMPIESTLSGTVRYKPGNAPAVNVPVFARPEGGRDTKIGVTSDFVTRTDGAGRFRFTGLPATAYNLRVFAQGDPPEWVAPVIMHVSVDQAQNAGPADLAYERGGWVEGVVREAGTGAPIPHAMLCALNPASEDFHNEAITLALTDAEGRYRALLPAGSSTLYFMKIPNGYAYPGDQGRKNATIAPGQRDPVKIDFELTAAELFKDPGRATISGRTIDAEGKPLAGVPIHDNRKYAIGQRTEETSLMLGRSGEDGTFRFSVDALGTHMISTGGEVYNPGAGSMLEFSRANGETFTAAKGESYPLGDFTVERYTLSLGGSVVDEAGNPIAEIYTHIQSGRPNFPGIMTTTDRNGDFAFRFVPKGPFKLTVWENGDRYETVTLDVEPGFDYQITLKRKSGSADPK